MPTKQTEKTPAKSALKPAQGASVKIVSPKAGQVIKGDSVPLEFKLTKGKSANMSMLTSTARWRACSKAPREP